MRFLARVGDDRAIQAAVINRAIELESEQRLRETKALIRGFAEAVGSIPLVRLQ